MTGAQSATAADRSRYRVEIIVFSHLEHAALPENVTQLDDYSSAVDFLAPPAEDDGEAPNEPEVEPEAEPQAEPGAQSGDGTGSGELAAQGAAAIDPWQAVTPVPEPGAEMQEAWRRLRLSGPFRPLQFLAWEQGGDAPFPTLRLHDLEVVHSEDPWAEARLRLAEGPAAGSEPSEPLPPPVNFYRLDGTASMRRSRFLHLALSLELREPLSSMAAGPSSDPTSGQSGDQTVIAARSVGDAPAALAAPAAFHVHRLQQSRVVGTGRMEYFDGPVLGVLAWVTDISDSFADAPAAPEGAQP